MRNASFITSCLVLGCIAAACGGRSRQSADANAAEPPVSTPEPGQPVRPPSSSVVAPVSFAEAESAYTTKRYSDALRLFTGYTSEHPSNVWGYYMLGLSAWKSGDRETAEKAFTLALEKDSTHTKSHLNLSRVLIEAGRPGDALPHVEAALKLDSTSSEGFRVLGRVKRELNDTVGAIAAYKRAIALDGHDAWSMNNLARAYIDQGKFDDALGPLARAVEIDSSAAAFRRNLEIALEHSSRVDLPSLARGFAEQVKSWK